MHLVIATLKSRPDAIDRLTDVLATLAEASRGDEGCQSYDFHRSVTDGDVFVSIEAWDSAEDARAHMGQPHVEEALSQVGDLLAAAPEIVLHDVASSGPMG